jgi:translation elongation factor EF-4
MQSRWNILTKEEYIELIEYSWPRGFSYEVSRSIAKGTFLIDAAQSIQAQTIFYKPILAENDLFPE